MVERTNFDDSAVTACGSHDLSPPPFFAPTETPSAKRLISLARVRSVSAIVADARCRIR